MYVYRDPDLDDRHDAARERDAAYWYGIREEDTGSASPELQQARGCFEPLVSSGGPPPGEPPLYSSSSAPSPSGAPDAATDPGAPVDDVDDSAHAHVRKLEEIKDLYLTAEAIGEKNVDKHFDQLLARQRELISEYFKQSGAARQAAADTAAARGGPAPQAPTGLTPGTTDHETTDGGSTGAGLVADKRFAW